MGTERLQKDIARNIYQGALIELALLVVSNAFLALVQNLQNASFWPDKPSQVISKAVPVTPWTPLPLSFLASILPFGNHCGVPDPSFPSLDDWSGFGSS